jgi:hypothetical protein
MALAAVKKPLNDRIERWVESAPTTLSRILLHPEDFLSISQSKRDKVEAQYNLPIVILGGRIALLKYIADHSDREETEPMEDIVYSDPVGERDEDITFVDPAKELENV